MSTRKKQQAVKELLRLNIKSAQNLAWAKRKMAKKFGIGILLNSEILKYLNISAGTRNLAGTQNPAFLRKLLRKRAVRTLSGIAPVAVLTKPYPCPGKCVYCPTEKGVPQSYLSNEPAVMRAIRCNYNPYVQVQDRLWALINNGHNPEKIELIVIGGTWSVLPKKYKYWFIAECFRGANDFPHPRPLPRSWRRGRGEMGKQNFSPLLAKEGDRGRLIREQKRNEKAKYKIIGITLETRPDYINQRELWEMRALGCTRVELGVQATDDKILKLNKRGHGVKETVEATKLLKNFGFKVTYHFMPGLPGSTPAKDLQMYKQLFADERFQPDQIKFYPTVVTKGSRLYRWWKAGKYKPYTGKQLENLIIKCKKITPAYVRIIRLIRDIPAESIMAGNLITNLRQVMAGRGVKCRCIRCRQAQERDLKFKNLDLRIKKYKASGGGEHFISYESKSASASPVPAGKILYGFCRLRLNDKELSSGYPELSSLSFAIIRELHVYGELTPISKKGPLRHSSSLPRSKTGEASKVQHLGLGKKLLKKAEEIAQKNGFKKIAVISGVGVRDYYRRQGYKLKNTYMIKDLT